jgi:hypothetical protein
LNELTPYLSNLLKGENYIHNNVKYQQVDAKVNTCGHHSIHRAYRLINNNLNLEQYHEYMINFRNKYNMSYDEIVANFVNYMLH